MRSLATLMLGISLVVGSLTVANADEKVRKAVYHCDFGDAKRFDAMLRNIYNLVNYYTTNGIFYDVRMVANSACVQFLLKDKAGTKFAKKQIPPKLAKAINDRMKTLVDAYGVKFEQCSITLQRLNIDKKKLEHFVATVPSAQVRVVELQDEGFAYIKVK